MTRTQWSSLIQTSSKAHSPTLPHAEEITLFLQATTDSEHTTRQSASRTGAGTANGNLLKERWRHHVTSARENFARVDARPFQDPTVRAALESHQRDRAAGSAFDDTA